MLLDQDTLRVVFGMKLRGLRLDKGLSLKDLAKKTGLSPSYINEIEKGKKSPKTEKVLILAQALDEKYEDLISLEFKRDLQLVQSLLEKKFLSGIPFELFGVPAATVFELLAEKPKKMRALVGTILEIAHAHNIQIDDFYFALLRAYIDMHENYFPKLEEAAKKTAVQLRLNSHSEAVKTRLIQALAQKKVSVHEGHLTDLSPDFKDLLYFISERGQKLHLAKDLDLTEQIFILARELGFHELRLKQRPPSSLISNLDSFEQLFNHFSANYFASSLLIPEDEIVADLKELFGANQWNPQTLQKILEKYPCNYESVFHRMTQVMSKHFGFRHLFFLRYEYDLKTQRYDIARELHLASPAGPHSVKGGHEHYCSRWLIYRLTQDQLKTGAKLSLGAQRSLYPRTSKEFLILSTAYRQSHRTDKITTVCVGVAADKSLEKAVLWSASPQIASYAVGETCERCAIADCSDRAVPLDPQLDPERFERVFRSLAQLNA